MSGTLCCLIASWELTQDPGALFFLVTLVFARNTVSGAVLTVLDLTRRWMPTLGWLRPGVSFRKVPSPGVHGHCCLPAFAVALEGFLMLHSSGWWPCCEQTACVH